MEAVGSRLGRSSSRYGQASVFSGPVRKWKKQWVWVHISASTATATYHDRNGYGYGNGNSAQSNNNVSAVRLCRWTPVPSSHINDSDQNSVALEQPPKRKFRYAPIVALEDKKKEADRSNNDETKSSEMTQSTLSSTLQRDEVSGKQNTENAVVEEIQTLNKWPRYESYLDLDLSLKGHDDNQDLGDTIMESRLKREHLGQYRTLN